MSNFINKFISYALLLACIITTSNADVYREWRSIKSHKVIKAKVIDKHFDKDVWKCHLVLESTKKGVWVKIDELSDPDKEYLSRWIIHEDRITVVDGEHIAPMSYNADRQLMYIHILKNVDPQIVKVVGRMGGDAESFEIPAYDKDFVLPESRLNSMNTQTIQSVCTFSKVSIKTIRIELYSIDGSLIDKWSMK